MERTITVATRICRKFFDLSYDFRSFGKKKREYKYFNSSCVKKYHSRKIELFELILNEFTVTIRDRLRK